MLSLLGLLIAAYLKLDVGHAPVGRVEKWTVDIPFSVYLGWITVAAVANLTDYLYLIHWTGSGLAPQAWAVLMLAVAGLLVLLTSLTRRDSGYAFVLAWSSIGIALKQASVPVVANSAWVLAAFALGMALLSLVQRRRALA
jgi:hypothetical protein